MWGLHGGGGGATVWLKAVGKPWVQTHNTPLEPFYYTYGYYFGLIQVDPSDAQRVYIGGVPLWTSGDGGATWTSIAADHVHVDHHALYVNPADPQHLISGNDGGINVSWDRGAHWNKCNTPAVGQCYAIEIDQQSPYHIYAGFQDNGTWVGPSDHEESPTWQATGHYAWESIGGGDGMQVEVDPRNPDVVITGYQFGNYTRQDRESGEGRDLRPMHGLGEPPLRWNWQTPVALSKHQPDVLYLCSNKVHRSLNQGETWETLSGDLTRGGRPGNVPYGTITAFQESGLRFGQLAVGTDDGRLHVSRDGGYTWVECPSPLPQSPPDRTLWVTEVMWDAHRRDRLYVALNGYRLDHFEAYVFVTDDDGRTWNRLFAELPPEPVNALAQPTAVGAGNWIFVGTDNGLYASLDGGRTAFVASPELPRVAVHDLAFHPVTQELVIGTHGRSVYVLDARPALEPAERRTFPTGTTAQAAPLPEVTHDPDWGKPRWDGTFDPLPTVGWEVFSPESRFLEWQVVGPDGEMVFTFTAVVDRGWQVVDVPLSWAVAADAPGEKASPLALRRPDDIGVPTLQKFLSPGTYAVRGVFRDIKWQVDLNTELLYEGTLVVKSAE